MLSEAEYQVHASDIDTLGQNYDQQIGDAIPDDMYKGPAIQAAKSFSFPYQKDLKQILDNALYQIAQNAVVHYQSQISTPLPESLAKDLVKDQYRKKYYGGTLASRIVMMRLRLNRVVHQTAQVGIGHLSGLHSNPIPFGAQSNISKRLLQGSAIKVEQDTARKVADLADYPLIRWTLAKNHTHYCECETLASRVDKDVIKYLTEHELDIEPEGLYLKDDLPLPPHPNCRCEWSLVKSDHEAVPSEGRRPVEKFRSLVRKVLNS